MTHFATKVQEDIVEQVRARSFTNSLDRLCSDPVRQRAATERR